MFDVLPLKMLCFYFQNGIAAIHLSCDPDVIKELISFGADPNLKVKVQQNYTHDIIRHHAECLLHLPFLSLPTVWMHTTASQSCWKKYKCSWSSSLLSCWSQYCGWGDLMILKMHDKEKAMKHLIYAMTEVHIATLC
jgi:hypothetical protein